MCPLDQDSQQHLARVPSEHLLDWLWLLLALYDAKVPTPQRPLNSGKFAGNAMRICCGDKNPQRIDCWILYYILLLGKLLKKACYGTTTKNQRCQLSPIYFEKVLGITIPPVNDALPGNQFGIGYLLSRPVKF